MLYEATPNEAISSKPTTWLVFVTMVKLQKASCSLFALTLFAFSLASCGRTSSTEGVLRVGNDAGFGGAETMDPYDGNRTWPTINMVFDRLIGVDEGFAPIPELALSWSSNVDLTEWTIQLRTGVKFHDGSEFDSEDVVYSIKRMIDPEFDSPIRAVLGVISSVRAVSKYEVLLTLATGEADLPLLLADYRALMTPVDSQSTIGKEPVGTGPFKMEVFDPAGTTVLLANEEYFFGRPQLDKIEVITFADSQSAAQALAGDQVDLLLAIDGKSSSMFGDKTKFTLQSIPSGDWNAIDFRVDREPFGDARVRKALRIAADRQVIADTVLGVGGGVVTCDTPVWSADPYRWDGDCPKDTEGAKKLLAEAGHPNGIEIEIYTSDVEVHMVELVTAYKDQVKDAGIRVTIRMADASGFWDDVWMKESAFVDSWGQRPATQVLNEVYRSTATWNPTGQADTELDKMLDGARATKNQAERAKKYAKIQEWLFENSAIFVPYHKTLTRAMSAKVKGIEPIVIDAVRWEKISVS
jgi:peptide/nickel transport system substrate-binding protein